MFFNMCVADDDDRDDSSDDETSSKDSKLDGKDDPHQQDEGEKKSPSKEKDKPVEQPRVLLTAPTGRAASILARRTGMVARTLHSVLHSAHRANQDPSKYQYARVEVLVVDECSMVAIQPLSGVLKNLLGHSLRKIVLLGDEHQLPSVQPGNFFEDVLAGQE